MKARVSPDFGEFKNGVVTIKLQDFEDFDYVIREKLLDHPYLVFRGQRDTNWPLRSSIDRLFFDQKKQFPTEKEAEQHLSTFKYATRGRLVSDWLPSDNDSWWSLGQHFGLATPLLDWTESPYVAAYFSFSEQQKTEKMTDRVVYAIDPVEIEKKNKKLNQNQRVEIIKPLLDQNPRLVNQRGLFTKIPLGNDLEEWIPRNFEGEDRMAVLIKMVIPESSGDRPKFLRVLNRKNINPLTLFPDLGGSSQHANNNIVIDNY
jgi:hypothetical protein